MAMPALSRRGLLALAAFLLAPLPSPAAGEAQLTVYAAASMTNALEDIAARYREETGVAITLSLGASSTLARQIEAGARADVFVSADQEWMDYLAARRLIDPASRRDIAGNRLVLIAPAGSTLQLAIAPGFALAAALGDGRLAVADPASVPAGRYAQAALTQLGAWDSVAKRLANADNVRAALAFVARDETPLGIVYATDAQIEPRVRVVDTFPAHTHPPITYPAALPTGAAAGARALLDYLGTPQSRAIFARYGFTPAVQTAP